MLRGEKRLALSEGSPSYARRTICALNAYLRTGAGKSSVMVALFRIVELVSGSISIDDVDISKLGLNDVRNAISIIPQDSTLCKN